MREAIVRPSALADVPALIALTKASWARTYDPIIGAAARKAVCDAKHVPALFEAEIAGADGVSALAEAGGGIVGHAGGRLRADGTLYIDRLHVAPDGQGTGLAARLLDAALVQVRTRAARVELTVLIGNERAMAFYRKAGFERVERRGPEHGMGGVGDIVMRRQLG